MPNDRATSERERLLKWLDSCSNEEDWMKVLANFRAVASLIRASAPPADVAEIIAQARTDASTLEEAGMPALAESVTLAADALAALARERDRLRSELSAAIGYMTNAAIDLDTNTPKRTTKATIDGGIKRARAALGGSDA